MYLTRYIKDCKWFAEQFPNEGEGSTLIWVRNVLYCSAKPKYFLGRLILWLICHILDPIINLVRFHSFHPGRKRKALKR